MMKSMYNNNDEIKKELKRLRLQRDISIEELKIIKHQLKDDLSFPNWIETALKALSKYGVYSLVKKIVS